MSLPIDFSSVAEALRRSTVGVRGSGPGGGSGVIWSTDGLIITNAHVVRGRDAIVQFWDGRESEASLRSIDPNRDLAALDVPLGNLPAAPIADSSRIRVGELAIAVGNPLGLTGAVTAGIVHATGGRFVQADVHLAPGNSGGPLADAAGRVIGINSMVAGGLGLAVPSNTVRQFLTGPRLGVTIQPVAGQGSVLLLVTGVEPGSPADDAGIIPGDILTGAGNTPLHDLDALAGALAAPDLSLEIMRGGRHVRVAIPPRAAQAA